MTASFVQKTIGVKHENEGKAKDGSYTEEVYMARQDDTTYTFDVPEAIDDPSDVRITFMGEFEPGQSDSSAFETSLGAGVAVSVVSGDNRAEIKGKVESFICEDRCPMFISQPRRSQFCADIP